MSISTAWRQSVALEREGERERLCPYVKWWNGIRAISIYLDMQYKIHKSKWCSVLLFQWSMLERGGWSAMGICILQYMAMIWCNSVPVIYALKQGGRSAMGICAFSNMWQWFSVVVFQWSMLAMGGRSAMGICPFFSMWNLVGVVVFHRSMVDWRRGVGSVCTGICAFFYMWNVCSVVVFHRSMVDWRGWGLSALVFVHSSICGTDSV